MDCVFPVSVSRFFSKGFLLFLSQLALFLVMPAVEAVWVDGF